MRKLASIQQVLAVDPIKGADRVEKITIQGWSVVSQKGNFKVGDLGVFYETDSIPPDIDLYKFLWTTKDNPEGIRPNNYRLKSMKLQKTLSQGLMLRLDQVIDAYNKAGLGVELDLRSHHVGSDLTTALGIEEWERPIENKVDFDGDWSFGFSGISRTDENNARSNIDVLDELRGLPYYITQKYDGTSMTCGLDSEGEFRVNNRSLSLRPPDGPYWHVARLYDIESYLREIEDHYIIQGEVCGPGIQKNHLGLKKPDFFVFDIYDTNTHSYLNYDELSRACIRMQLKMVETIERGTAFDYSIEQLLQLAEGVYEGTENEREGIVIRPSEESIYSPSLGRKLSFKIINNLYSLVEAKD